MRRLRSGNRKARRKIERQHRITGARNWRRLIGRKARKALRSSRSWPALEGYEEFLASLRGYDCNSTAHIYQGDDPIGEPDEALSLARGAAA